MKTLVAKMKENFIQEMFADMTFAILPKHRGNNDHTLH